MSVTLTDRERTAIKSLRTSKVAVNDIAAAFGITANRVYGLTSTPGVRAHKSSPLQAGLVVTKARSTKDSGGGRTKNDPTVAPATMTKARRKAVVKL